MATSQQLRLEDVQAAFRLVIEVREHQADQMAWKTHLLAGICKLIGANSGFAVEAPIPLDPDNPGMVNLVEVGWITPAQRQVCAEYFKVQKLAGDPSIPPFAAYSGRSVSLTRDQLVDQRTWYASDHVNVVRRTADSDAFVLSQQVIPELGIKQVFQVSRSWKDATPFEPRHRRIVRLVHQELGRLWQRDLEHQRNNPINQLPPRLRQTLDLLRQGNSEKQIAAQLSITRHGAHNLIRRLHRRFNVATRGELLAFAEAHPPHGFNAAAVWP